MWLSAIKLAFDAAGHIYKNKQQTKMLMSDAQMRHAEAMAKGEKEFQGQLLEARQSDWKDEFILLFLLNFISTLSLSGRKTFLQKFLQVLFFVFIFLLADFKVIIVFIL